MKHLSVVSRRSSVFIFIISLLFSACSQASNTNIGYDKTSQPNYSSTSNAASMNTSSGMAENQRMRGDFESEAAGAEKYAEIDENPFVETARAPLSTFSIDVDTASYANVRRYLNEGSLPPKDAVRIEELINYFEYDYPQPIGNAPFSVNTEAATAPWNAKHKLVSIGLQGKKVSLDDVPPSNLVFLVDVSGSMNDSRKLPLLKNALQILVNQLTAKDRVAIVVYAGSSGLVLDSTNNRGEILNALNNLEAGGSTNGGQGIQLAYRVALDNFIEGGNNRVILATDGDFNVGLTGDEELVKLIEAKRRSGIFLSVLGFGTDNTNDSMMEKIADKGNGNYAYIDSQEEARKALGEQVAGTLYTIAKDVKIQVEFNPALVAGYRLIGYENRLLANRDFNNDKKDAGEIGAGHSVTALYEIVPAGQKVENDGIELKYSKTEPSESDFEDEILTVKLRYKEPNETESKLLTQGLLDRGNLIENASDNLKFAASVAEFGLLLRNSRYKGSANFRNVNNLAESSLGSDLKNYRNEFLDLVKKASRLKS
ncbi:MAG: VWA domain-containing protein [Acidobacteria bacterium]|nr:VWA domain-containing protein [Acidobacteriota bacterium]MCA1639866.1 VWA domain-containing protein [Acidobacteriota bacterium]